MTAKSRAGLASDISTKLADNAAGDISALDLRETETDSNDSAFNLTDDDTDDVTEGISKFTTAGDITKLAGIEALADVTDSTNVLSSLVGQAAAVATINTGQGANEVYAMDQAVQTSDAVAFGSVVAPLPLNAQTGTTYTFVLTDADKYVTLSNAAAIAATVPPNSTAAFPIGTKINANQLGAGQVTYTAGAGVTINTPSTLLSRAQFSTVTLVKVATDTWNVMGDLEAA